MVIFLTIGLVNVFKLFPIIQIIIKYLGTLFLIYLAYKIASSTNSDETQKENPVKFIETFFFQYLNLSGLYKCLNSRPMPSRYVFQKICGNLHIKDYYPIV